MRLIGYLIRKLAAYVLSLMGQSKCQSHTNQQGILKQKSTHILGAFTKLRKAIISFVMSVCPSVCLSVWKNSAPTGQIFIKFHI